MCGSRAKKSEHLAVKVRLNYGCVELTTGMCSVACDKLGTVVAMIDTIESSHSCGVGEVRCI